MSRTVQRVIVPLISAVALTAASAPVIQTLMSSGQITANSGDRNSPTSGFAIKTEHVGAAQSADRRQASNPAANSLPHLILQPSAAGAAANSLPLGAEVTGDADGLAVELKGLPKGMTLSTGRPLGAGGWRILAESARDAEIKPPAGFSGKVDLAVELRLADDRVVERGSVHREWLPGSAGAPARTAGDTPIRHDATGAVAAAAVPAELSTARYPAKSQPQLDQDEIELFVRRGQALISDGDIAAGRVLLERAAEAGDPRAALALAATYDPARAAMLHAQGGADDEALARNASNTNGEPTLHKRRPRLSATVKLKRPVAHQAIRAQTPPAEPDGIYLGNDPDPRIRATLNRDLLG
jgi:hypothetical protein